MVKPDLISSRGWNPRFKAVKIPKSAVAGHSANGETMN
jgi:hypothetical protein